jgi:hypothetical protein
MRVAGERCTSPCKDGAVTEPLNLEIVTTYCSSNTCPTVYRSDKGTLVVQGYTVTADRAGVDLPDGEMLVEIPAELLREAVRLLD